MLAYVETVRVMPADFRSKVSEQSRLVALTVECKSEK